MRKIVVIFLLLLAFSCKKSEISDNREKDLEIYEWSNKDIQDFYKDKNYTLIILNFWATFCSPCKEEMKDFAKLYNEYKNKNVLVIGASIDSKEQKDLVKKIALFLNVSYPILYNVSPNFNGNEIVGLPKTFIIKDNKIMLEIDGKRDYNYFKKIIQENVATQ